MSHKIICSLQLGTICLMWIFVLGVMVFIPWLVFVAARWHDALNWSVVIAVVFLPVYLIVAAVLTYVYFGLRRSSPASGDQTGEKEEGPGWHK